MGYTVIRHPNLCFLYITYIYIYFDESSTSTFYVSGASFSVEESINREIILQRLPAFLGIMNVHYIIPCSICKYEHTKATYDSNKHVSSASSLV